MTFATGVICGPGNDSVVGPIAFGGVLLQVVGDIDVELSLPFGDWDPFVVRRYEYSVMYRLLGSVAGLLSILFAGNLHRSQDSGSKTAT